MSGPFGSPLRARARARARVGDGNQKPWPADKVERWSIDRLIPYAKNARTHTEAQVAAIDDRSPRPPSPAESVVVVAEVMVAAEIAAQIARLRSPTSDGALRSLRWKVELNRLDELVLHGGPMVRIHLPPAQSPCKPDALDQVSENFAERLRVTGRMM